MEENNNNAQNSNSKQSQQNSLNGALIRNLLICVGLILIVLVVFWAINTTSKGKEVDVIELTNNIEAGNVSKIELDSKYIIAEYNDGTVVYINNSNDVNKLIYASLDTLRENSADVYNKMSVVTGSSTTFNILNILYPILMVVVLYIVFKMILKQIGASNNKTFDFVKNRARVTPSKVKFSDVAGSDEEKAELEEIIAFLKSPDHFIKMGARIPKGVLLVGQPGTGKTMLAKACAGEANVPFFSISGSDFMELFVGVGASRVRDLFETAKKAKPCIIFIDEIDAIGRQRGAGLGGGNDEREQTLNQLLVQMDGFESNEGIIVLAATNRVDILDPALLRPGRFDRRIFINLPDVKGREAILKVHSKNKPLDSNVNLQHIARITSGFTGADIENMLNEAALLAAKGKNKTITMENLNDAIAKVTMGPQKKSYVITEKDKNITATHEAGHAIVGKCVVHSDPIHEVSIVPRGNAGGYTLSRPDSDDRYILKGKLLDTITMMLGGRTAEKLFLDDITTGASNDIERATSIARSMVTEWGMSDKVGLMHLGSEGGEVFIGRDYASKANYSETEAAVIDAEVKKIIDFCAKEAERILSENKDKLKTMVEILIEKETIYQDEVDMIMAGKSKDEILAVIKMKSEQKTEKTAEDKPIEKAQNATAESTLASSDDKSKKTQNATSESGKNSTKIGNNGKNIGAEATLDIDEVIKIAEARAKELEGQKSANAIEAIKKEDTTKKLAESTSKQTKNAPIENKKASTKTKTTSNKVADTKKSEKSANSAKKSTTNKK